MKLFARAVYASAFALTTAWAASADVTIGVTLPLTGYAASYGEDAKRGADLAVEQANAAGGIKGEKVRLLVEDDAGVGKSGVAATQKLVNVDKVPVIIGGMMSAVALPASPIARSNKVVYLSTMSSHPELTATPGGFIYRLAGSDALHGVIEADFAVKQLKAKTAVGLFATTDYGAINGKIVRETFEKLGGKWLTTDNFKQGATDYRTQLAKLKEQNADILFLVATHKEAAQIFRQMVELNYKIPVMGTSFLDDPAIFELAGDAANGVYFTTSAVEPAPGTKKQREEFQAAFKAKYNKEPGITAFYFYDATRLVIDAIKATGTSGAEINKWLTEVKNYPGVTATISFTPTGDSIIPVTIKKIENRKFVDTGYTLTAK
jgi:branched-chain amino acid transport system substrate-binding protein